MELQILSINTTRGQKQQQQRKGFAAFCYFYYGRIRVQQNGSFVWHRSVRYAVGFCSGVFWVFHCIQHNTLQTLVGKTLVPTEVMITRYIDSIKDPDDSMYYDSNLCVRMNVCGSEFMNLRGTYY